MNTFTNDNCENLNNPVGVLTYFKLIFLTLIPFFGLLYSITLSFKPKVDKNQKNLARAILLFQLLLIIIISILFFYIWNNIISPLLGTINSVAIPTYTNSLNIEQTLNSVQTYEGLNIFDYFSEF